MNDKKEYPNLNTPNAIKNRFSGERAVEEGKKGNKKRSENIQLKKLLIKMIGELPNDNTAYNIENQKHDLDTIVNALKGVNDDTEETE